MAGAYQPETNPGGSAAFSGASPEAFGAGIGRGLEEAGGVAQEIGARWKAADLSAQNAAAAVEFSKVSTTLDKAEIDNRDTAAPGGAGHTQAIDQFATDQIGQALGNIKDPKLRESYQARYAELQGGISTRAYAWERSAHTEKMVTDAGQATDTLAKGQEINPDPLGLQVSIDTTSTMWNNMVKTGAVSADVAEKGKREGWNAIAGSFANAMIDKNPKALLGDPATKQKGILEQLSPYLTDEQVKTLQSGARIEIRRQDAQARAQLDHNKALANEDLSLFKDKISKGYVPTDQEWIDKTSQAKQFGLDKEVFDIGVLHDQANINREYRDATPIQLHSLINDLEAKKAAGKTSNDENIHLDNIKQFAAGAIQRFNADPYAAAAAAGNQAPTVDWSNPDPKALEQRATWAKAWAKSSGLVDVPYLNNDELKQFRDLAAQGPGGQLKVAELMRQAFHDDAGAAVRQLDPSNQDMALMVGLHPRMSQLYKEGVAALKAGTVKLGAGPEDEQAMRDAFAKYMPAVPAGMQDAVERAARNITAGTAAEFANTNPSGDVLLRNFDQSVQRAGGRTGQVTSMDAPGGFAEWNGRYTWLPSNVSSRQFIGAISRADAPAWSNAAGGDPYYRGPDGKLTKMSESQVAHLKEYPLALGTDAQGRQIPGVYRLVMTGGGFVGNKDGSPWQFDIRKLGFSAALAAAHYSRH